MNARGFEVVGFFCGSPYSLRRIFEGLGAAYVDLREPFLTNMIADSADTANVCHQDGRSPFSPSNVKLLCWSNRESTIICASGEHPDQSFPPGALLLIENLMVTHRAPVPVSPDRYFIRVSEVSDQYVEKVREYLSAEPCEPQGEPLYNP